MIFTRIFILSLFIVYSNKYSFEQFLEFLSNQWGLTNFSNILIAVFIKREFDYEFRVFTKAAVLVLVLVLAMSAAAFCGVAPFIFRMKPPAFQVLSFPRFSVFILFCCVIIVGESWLCL